MAHPFPAPGDLFIIFIYKFPANFSINQRGRMMNIPIENNRLSIVLPFERTAA